MIGLLLACAGSGPKDAGTPLVPSSDVVVGFGFSCALTRDGAPVCWGEDAAELQAPPSSSYKDLDAGAAYVCGIETEGAISCWRFPDERSAYLDEIVLNAPAGEFGSLSASWWGACALDLDGVPVCWGNEGFEARVPAHLTFSTLEMSHDGGCGLLTDGTIHCFCVPEGCPLDGEAVPTGTWSQIAVGYEHACALDEEGLVECWGWSAGEGEVDGVRFKAISAGDAYTCGVTLDGFVQCWDTHYEGRFNNNEDWPEYDSVWLTAPAGTFIDVEVEWEIGAAVTSERDIVTFGYDLGGGSFQEAAGAAAE